MVAITSRVFGLLVLSATLAVAHPEPVDLEERNAPTTTVYASTVTPIAGTTFSSRLVNATTVTLSATSVPTCGYSDPAICYCAPGPTSVPTTVTTIVVPHPTTITLTVPAPYPYPTVEATSRASAIASSIYLNITTVSVSHAKTYSSSSANLTTHFATSVVAHPTSTYSYPTACARPTIYVYGNGNYTDYPYPISSVLGNVTTVYANQTYPTPEPTYD